MSVTYTKAINKGVLYLSKMEIGATVSGTITGVEPGKFGPVLLLQLPKGEGIRVFTAGNVSRFFNEDAAQGKYDVGNSLTITRREDLQMKNGFNSSSFYVKSEKLNGSKTTTNNVQPIQSKPTKQDLIKAELEAARKRDAVNE